MAARRASRRRFPGIRSRSGPTDVETAVTILSVCVVPGQTCRILWYLGHTILLGRDSDEAPVPGGRGDGCVRLRGVFGVLGVRLRRFDHAGSATGRDSGTH